MEGQVWIALYNLLSKPQAASKYEISEFRKSILLKCLKYLNEDIESQLPFLKSFKKWLLQLQMGQCPLPDAKKSLLIETVASIRESLFDK